MSRMRTQELLPVDCRMTGNSRSAMAAIRKTMSLPIFVFIMVLLLPVRRDLPRVHPTSPMGEGVSTMASTMKAKMSVYWLPSTPPVSLPR